MVFRVDLNWLKLTLKGKDYVNGKRQVKNAAFDDSCLVKPLCTLQA